MLPAPRSSRLALTLIELLVTIVILVTLLAAVLPAVSPNNEGRKIREASRQLVSLFQQAQAQAARDGRLVGVGFNDTWNDLDADGVIGPGELTGIALEAYIIAEPPPFTGFSTGAAVRCEDPNSNAPPVRQVDPPLVNLTFGRGVGGEGMMVDGSDGIPPNMFRGAFMIDLDGDGFAEARGTGDIVEVGHELFELVTNDCDDVDDTDNTPDTVDDSETGMLRSQATVTARWLSWRGRYPQLRPRGGKAYRIRRPPMANVSPSRTAAEAIQFPRGIGIDIDATKGDRIVGIVFSPNGAVDAIYQDGVKEYGNEPFFILLGLVENANAWTGGPPGELTAEAFAKYDFRGTPTDPDDDELAQRRREVNLFNGDSRWVTITPAGRVVSAENALFDPRTLLQDPNDPSQGRFVDNLSGAEIDQLRAQRVRFRDEAQRYARQLESEGGG